MPLTIADVRATLEAFEPDYAEGASLGQDAMPFLAELMGDPEVAPAAVCLASLIGGDDAAQLLRTAASDPSTAIRFQAAAAAHNLEGEQAEEIVRVALDDEDAGVRRAAIRSVQRISQTAPISEAMRTRLSSLSESDPHDFVREAARDLLRVP